MKSVTRDVGVVLFVAVGSVFGAPVGDQSEAVKRPLAPCVTDWPEGNARDALSDFFLWPDGVVPYAFAEDVSLENRERSIDAMREVMSVCGVQFIPRESLDDPAYIRFENSTGMFNSGGYGHTGGVRRIRMFNWESKYTIVHEIMHTLGSYHEHQRPDRDMYVQINHQNIVSGSAISNFSSQPGIDVVGPYDFDSVMHYPQFAFSENGKPTITVLPPNEHQQELIGQTERISEGDAFGLSFYYGERSAADLNLDGVVDSGDLAVLLAAWGSEAPDLDGDGVAGSSDLAILLAAWG